MRAVVIAPHLDDGVLSCGATIARHVRRGEAVTVVTVFAGWPGGPLSPLARRLHAQWGVTDAVTARRREDLCACRRLGAAAVHLDFLDAIYRTARSGAPRYRRRADLFRPRLAAADADLASAVAVALRRWVAGSDVVYAPRAVGGHVDHRLVRRAVERLGAAGRRLRLLYYEDLPYALDAGPRGGRADGRGLAVHSSGPVSAGDWRRKLHAVRAYRSQLRMLWKGGDWAGALRRHARRVTGGLGERLWERRGAVP